MGRMFPMVKAGLGYAKECRRVAVGGNAGSVVARGQRQLRPVHPQFLAAERFQREHGVNPRSVGGLLQALLGG